jgi:hypothetical protein
MAHARALRLLGVFALAISTSTARAADPLPSWSDTAPKKAIITFVENVTKKKSPAFVPAPERIATFDNDGTLWVEQPMYIQAMFVFDRIEALAPRIRNGRRPSPSRPCFEATRRPLSQAAKERCSKWSWPRTRA